MSTCDADFSTLCCIHLFLFLRLWNFEINSKDLRSLLFLVNEYIARSFPISNNVRVTSLFHHFNRDFFAHCWHNLEDHLRLHIKVSNCNHNPHNENFATLARNGLFRTRCCTRGIFARAQQSPYTHYVPLVWSPII